VEFRVGYPAAWRARVLVHGLASALALPWIGTSEDCSFHRLATALFAAHGQRFAPAIRTDQEALLLDLVAQQAGLALVRSDMLAGAGPAVAVLDEVRINAGMHFVAPLNPAKPALLRLARQALYRAWPVRPAAGASSTDRR
jgi:hypothetical protein